MNIKIELATCGEHTLVIVNREWCLYDMQTWGDDTFIIDIWDQNQFPQNALTRGLYWADGYNFLKNWLWMQAFCRVILDITLRDHLNF
jgi:hypothetical protein